MPDVSEASVGFVRLVLTPHGKTLPVVLVMIETKTKHVIYKYDPTNNWIGDDQGIMFWNTSTSLTEAHEIYKRGVGNETNGEIELFVDTGS